MGLIRGLSNVGFEKQIIIAYFVADYRSTLSNTFDMDNSKDM